MKHIKEIQKLDVTTMVFTGAYDRNMRLVQKVNEIIEALNKLNKEEEKTELLLEFMQQVNEWHLKHNKEE